jgi:hypothetical protein
MTSAMRLSPRGVRPGGGAVRRGVLGDALLRLLQQRRGGRGELAARLLLRPQPRKNNCREARDQLVVLLLGAASGRRKLALQHFSGL